LANDDRKLRQPLWDENGAEPHSTPTAGQEVTEPVRRRTFVELTDTSTLAPASIRRGAEQFATRIGTPS
jgi:hypothetical protein